MVGVPLLAATWFVACAQASEELVIEPASLRATLVSAAREWCPGEVDLGGLELVAEGSWRLATSLALAPAERLALATSLVPGEWKWIATDAGARLRRRGVAEARMLEEILSRETVDFLDRWGESRVETLVRLAEESDLELVLGANVARALPDGVRGGWLDSPEAGEATVAATFDRLLGAHLRRVSRAGCVIVVRRDRADSIETAEAGELDLRAKLEGRRLLEFGPRATVGDLLERLSVALGVPVLLDPAAAAPLDRTCAIGAVFAGRVPVRAGLWFLEHATETRACVVGNAVWLAVGERARVLHMGPWGDVLLEHELRRWPLALPPDARRLPDAQALIAKEGLALVLEARWRKALARFDMELASPRASSSTVADVLDRLSSACGAGGWHVYRGEIRLGPAPRDVSGSGER